MNLRIKLSAILLLTLATVSCKKTLDINDDPNNPTDVGTRLLLPSAQVNLAYQLGGDASLVTGNIVQHYGGHRGQPLEYNQYNITPSSTDGLWSTMYAGVLRDLKEITTKSRASGDSMYVGVSQILTALSYSVLTDLYGDIPFSQALSEIENINPAYDKQEAIYPALVAMIDAGVANVKSNKGVKPGNDDVVYRGNMVNWEKFGNSIKLRLLNHLSKRQPAAAAAFLNTNPLLITSNAESARVVFGGTDANANPIYQFDELSGRKDNAVSATLVTKLQQLSDPRIPVYFRTVRSGARQGQYFGNRPGDDTDDAGESLYSRVGTAYASVNSPVYFLSHAEVKFIIAEVRLREGKTADAATAYNAAITSDFESLGLSSSVGAYLLKPEVVFNNSLQRLIEQKWITLFQAPYEAWVDYRRTGFPTLAAGTVNRTNGVIPRRLPYPQLEINLNRASLAAGPGVPVPFETLKTRVWWDAP